MQLSSLLSPFGERAFFSEFWEQKEFFSRPPDINWSDSFISIGDLNDYLARNDLRYPCLRLAMNGKELPLAEYSKTLKFGDYTASGLIQPDRLMECYQRGATIVVQLAHESFPKLSRLAVDLESALDFNVQMTVYLTPPNSRALTAHYDTHNVIVVQIAGSKTWKVYDFEKRAPLLTNTFDQASFTLPKNGRPYELKAGSVLYVPRGMVHEASANSEPSLHITVGLFPPLWTDLFHDHLRDLESDERFRRSPFWSTAANPDRMTTEQELADLMKLFVDKFDFEKLKDRAINKGIHGNIQNHQNRLLDTISLSSIDAQTEFRTRPHLRWRLFATLEGCAIRCFDKELQFSRSLAPILEAILNRHGTFSPATLDVPMDEAGKVKLCSRLLKEGLLTIH